MASETDFILERLREAPIFRAISHTELAKLATEVEIVRLNAGATLAEQGAEADGAYVLVSGRLRAFAVQPDGSEVAVGEIASGELVGEMALLTSTARTATVRAVRDCQLLFVNADVFSRLIHGSPEATLAIARVLVERLERANIGRQAAPRRRAITMVPAFGDASHAIDDLVKATSGMTDLEVVDATSVNAAVGADHSEAELVHWLHRLEAEADLVVYLADDLESQWGRRCLRQADHVVAVDADPGTSRDHRVIEILEGQTVGAVGTSVDAVVVHPTSRERPRGGHRWVQGNRIRCHHIRLGSHSDNARMARSILRRDIAMVLSGGGARGMAHLGVMRAFEESAIPIDAIGGTSFGAIMAVARALDLRWPLMRDMLWEAVGRDGAPVDLTVPLLALSKGRRVAKVLEDAFGVARLEDTWLPTYCVSSNLSTGHPLVHSSGSAVAAIRASMAIPGVFPPVAGGDGEVLVDGAVMNNLPVDVMRDFSSGGPIIAVNLRSPAKMEAGELPTDGIVSGWNLLRRRLHPRRPNTRVPSIVEILARANEISGSEAARVMEQAADFVLNPPTGDHALLDFGALDDLVQLGYEYTTSELESWRQTGLLRSLCLNAPYSVD